MTSTQAQHEDWHHEDWHAAVELILAARREARAVITYKDLARDAAVPPPHTIHKLTLFLEQLIETDIALGQPLRAALAVSRSRGIPGDGFFVKLKDCGLQPEHGEDEADWHQRLLNQL
ncbi:MAG: hypothetical protein J4F41_07225 [Alphaproteobacteria bacterium]|nr:hypothetical protein [Alphaproteobacteria bacterium]